MLLGEPCLGWEARASAWTQVSGAGGGRFFGCGAVLGSLSGPLGQGQKRWGRRRHWLCSPAFFSHPRLRHRQKVGSSLLQCPQSHDVLQPGATWSQIHPCPGGVWCLVHFPPPVDPCSSKMRHSGWENWVLPAQWPSIGKSQSLSCSGGPGAAHPFHWMPREAQYSLRSQKEHVPRRGSWVAGSGAPCCLALLPRDLGPHRPGPCHQPPTRLFSGSQLRGLDVGHSCPHCPPGTWSSGRSWAQSLQGVCR